MISPAFETWITFVTASIIFIAAPGPDTILLLGQGISQGRIAGLGIAIGCALGCCLHTVLASLGISAILASSDSLFDLFKYVGAFYLFYLGFKSFSLTTSKLNFSRSFDSNNDRRLSNFIGRGFLSNSLNPKVALFFMSFLPQFVTQAKGNVSYQMIALGLQFAFILLITFGIIGLFAGQIAKGFNRHPGIQKWLDRLAGITCFLLAAKMLFVTKYL